MQYKKTRVEEQGDAFLESREGNRQLLDIAWNAFIVLNILILKRSWRRGQIPIKTHCDTTWARTA